MRLFRSMIRSESVTRSERVLGYFLGPALVYLVYSGLAGSYLTQFYTDVLGLAGGLLTLMPLVSKVFDCVCCFVIGRLIDRTRTSQGKARPWIPAAGVLLAVFGVLLYAVPRAAFEVQMVWVVISYNLFFGLAYSLYSLSHSLMVPLSTRDTRQRDGLAMLSSMGTAMIPGMLVTIVMPLLVSRIGVGAGAQGAWMSVMSVLSIVAIPATLIEYYFTRERVTAESGAGEKAPQVALREQVRACFGDRYWVMIVVFMLVQTLANSLSGASMLYYCNWVLGSSVAEGASKQIMINVIGQAPMGLGAFVVMPLVRKFGKRRVTIAGFALAAAGSLVVLLGSGSMAAVLAGLFIKSIGALPTYIMAAHLADALDHVERRSGFRADGFSASFTNIVTVVAGGVGQTVLLGCISALGYVAPESAAQVITQPAAVQGFFNFCYAGMPMISFAVCAVIMIFFGVESKLKKARDESRGESAAAEEEAA